MRLAVLLAALAMAEPEHVPRNGAARRRLRLKQVGWALEACCLSRRAHPLSLHSGTFHHACSPARPLGDRAWAQEAAAAEAAGPVVVLAIGGPSFPSLDFDPPPLAHTNTAGGIPDSTTAGTRFKITGTPLYLKPVERSSLVPQSFCHTPAPSARTL